MDVSEWLLCHSKKPYHGLHGREKNVKIEYIMYCVFFVLCCFAGVLFLCCGVKSCTFLQCATHSLVWFYGKIVIHINIKIAHTSEATVQI